LKFEEQSRNSQEIIFRNEILKLQETFARVRVFERFREEIFKIERES